MAKKSTPSRARRHDEFETIKVRVTVALWGHPTVNGQPGADADASHCKNSQELVAHVARVLGIGQDVRGAQAWTLRVICGR